MCYHKQDRAIAAELEVRYEAVMRDIGYQPVYYENGFDFKPSPVITVQRPKEFQMIHWGLVPGWVKSATEARQIRMKTLNAISEEMFEKPSFRDSLSESRRCLIPCTGFFEWRWLNGGKSKYPYFIHAKQEPIFSLAGIWSSWMDRSTGEELNTYSVLTTRANPLLEKIHNSKKRMPVILPRQYEKDWLNPSLAKEDVLALCEPIGDEALSAYTISKMITDRKVEDKNTEAISRPFEYPELALIDS
jgi:putative SOS response-associated peptidase YedK